MDSVTGGTTWAHELQAVLAKAGADTARAYLDAGNECKEDDVVVAIQSTFYVAFKRQERSLALDENGTELAAVRCVCTRTQPGVCVCVGACTDQDDCKDDAGGPIVARA